MTIDWTACLVLLTGCGLICGGFAYVTHLIVRAEVGGLSKIFVPRREQDLRDKEVDRRFEHLEANAAGR